MIRYDVLIHTTDLLCRILGKLYILLSTFLINLSEICIILPEIFRI